MSTRPHVLVFQSQNEVTLLRNEVAQLKQLLLAHKDCPVTALQKKTQGYLGERCLLLLLPGGSTAAGTTKGGNLCLRLCPITSCPLSPPAASRGLFVPALGGIAPTQPLRAARRALHGFKVKDHRCSESGLRNGQAVSVASRGSRSPSLRLASEWFRKLKASFLSSHFLPFLPLIFYTTYFVLS